MPEEEEVVVLEVIALEGLGIRYFDDRLRVERGD